MQYYAISAIILVEIVNEAYIQLKLTWQSVLASVARTDCKVRLETLKTIQ